MRWNAIVIASLLFCLTGCSTYRNLFEPVAGSGGGAAHEPKRAPFGGSREAWGVLRDLRTDDVCVINYYLAPLHAIDLVFSFAGDILSLPYTLYEDYRRRHIVPRP